VKEHAKTLVVTELLNFGYFAFVRGIGSTNHLYPGGIQVSGEFDVKVMQTKKGKLFRRSH